MSLGNPFCGNPPSVLQLTATNTVSAVNATFTPPVGSDVFVTNPNSGSVVFVLLSNSGATNTVASNTSTGGGFQGVPIAPLTSAILKAPWPAATNVSGQCQVSAIQASGGNTSNLYLAAGYGSEH